MTRLLTLLALAASIALALGAGPPSRNASADTIATGFGVADLNGRPALVEVFVAVPAGFYAGEAVRSAVRAQGAHPVDSAEFSTTGMVWDQFDDGNAGNNFVTQHYNAAGDRSGGAALTALTNTHATWTDVPASSFALTYGGATSRCPSLVKQCAGPQFFDGFNDVGWIDLGRCRMTCTLGVTWYNTSTDEADMALNTRATWRTDGGNFDVETVLLHENGHVAGLGHSSVAQAVMYAYYGGVRRSLHQDDIGGIVALYP